MIFEKLHVQWVLLGQRSKATLAAFKILRATASVEKYPSYAPKLQGEMWFVKYM